MFLSNRFNVLLLIVAGVLVGSALGECRSSRERRRGAGYESRIFQVRLRRPRTSRIGRIFRQGRGARGGGHCALGSIITISIIIRRSSAP